MTYEFKPIQLLLLLNFIIFEGKKYDSKDERYRWSFTCNKDPSAVPWN